MKKIIISIFVSTFLVVSNNIATARADQVDTTKLAQLLCQILNSGDIPDAMGKFGEVEMKSREIKRERIPGQSQRTLELLDRARKKLGPSLTTSYTHSLKTRKFELEYKFIRKIYTKGKLKGEVSEFSNEFNFESKRSVPIFESVSEVRQWLKPLGKIIMDVDKDENSDQSITELNAVNAYDYESGESKNDPLDYKWLLYTTFFDKIEDGKIMGSTYFHLEWDGPEYAHFNKNFCKIQ